MQTKEAPMAEERDKWCGGCLQASPLFLSSFLFQKTEIVWLGWRVHVCVLCLRRQDQTGCLTAPYLGRFDLHS